MGIKIQKMATLQACAISNMLHLRSLLYKPGYFLGAAMTNLRQNFSWTLRTVFYYKFCYWPLKAWIRRKQMPVISQSVESAIEKIFL